MTGTAHSARGDGRRLILAAACACLLVGAGAAAAATDAWVLALRDSVTVPAGPVTLAQVCAVPPPAAAADLVVAGPLAPGQAAAVDRRAVLRELTLRRAAGRVVCRGAERCAVQAAGRRLPAGRLERSLLAALRPWLPPPAAPDAPPTTLELAGPLPALPVGREWRLELLSPRRLAAGRNLVRAAVRSGAARHLFTATVVCHHWVRVPHARRSLAVDQLLTPDLVTWRWEDAAGLAPSLLRGEVALEGLVVRRAVAAGAPLRETDVAPVPLVRRGDRVELVLARGAVAVTTSGVAREDGTRDQLIYVRNDLDGRLIKGRVTGPGRVAWGR